jgi:hypothetical protein
MLEDDSWTYSKQSIQLFPGYMIVFLQPLLPYYQFICNLTLETTKRTALQQYHMDTNLQQPPWQYPIKPRFAVGDAAEYHVLGGDNIDVNITARALYQSPSGYGWYYRLVARSGYSAAVNGWIADHWLDTNVVGDKLTPAKLNETVEPRLLPPPNKSEPSQTIFASGLPAPKFTIGDHVRFWDFSTGREGHGHICTVRQPWSGSLQYQVRVIGWSNQQTVRYDTDWFFEETLARDDDPRYVRK